MKPLAFLFRLINTLRYLKLSQLYYQVFYRIKSRIIKIHWYNSYKKYSICPFNCSLDNLLVLSKYKYQQKFQFTFLNLQHSFDNEVDWNFMEYGKLWNYNLQYFDYLQDDMISIEERFSLLKDFSVSLLNNFIKPEPYPVSLRIINTCIFLSKNHIYDEKINDALKLQIGYLEHNLEYHVLANHLLENIFALYISAYALKDQRLFNKAAGLLNNQLKEQILADGAHFERSPMYHSIILSKLLLCIHISRENPSFGATSSCSEEYAQLMLGWINNYSFPDGSWALMNDAAINVALTTRDLNIVAKRIGLIPVHKALNQSGFRKLKGDDWEAIINVGNITPTYQPGHAHADMLNFCLWYRGKQIVIDTGISTYNNNSRRHHERSTVAHNTVTVNGNNQSDIWSSFRVGRRANCYLLTDKFMELSAWQNGYARKNKIIHVRTFKSSKNQLSILDEIKSKRAKKNADICSGIIFHPSIMVELSDQVIESDNNFSLAFFGDGDLEDVECSEQYNKLATTKSLKVHFNTTSLLRFDFK